MTAQAFLAGHPEWVGNWRIDVIAIQKSGSGSLPEIVHYENAVMGG
jgi:Holliday junction resolvase-like predicted endonuclease